jgi:uncharacterized membrane protein
MAETTFTGGHSVDRHSHAAIRRHPLHPMIVPFPIAFLIGTLASDIAFRATGDPFWARGSEWLIIAALVMGAIAAVFGIIDFISIRDARRGGTGWAHALGNVTAVVLSIINLVLRLTDGATTVTTAEFVLSIIVAAMLFVTGWLGGELVYRQKIGIT